MLLLNACFSGLSAIFLIRRHINDNQYHFLAVIFACPVPETRLCKIVCGTGIHHKHALIFGTNQSATGKYDLKYLISTKQVSGFFIDSRGKDFVKDSAQIALFPLTLI